MTDKGIIMIDGVDITQFNSDELACMNRYDVARLFIGLVEELQHKEQECKKMKDECKKHRRNAVRYCNSYQSSYAENGMTTNKMYQYKQALDEVLSIATNSDMLPCADFEVDCTKCKDRITEKGKRCMRYGLIKIKNVIEKTKDGK